MAKDKRFPSNVNVQKDAKESEKKPAPKAPEKEAVQGVRQSLVEIQYNKENHHYLDHVYSLRKGLNHVPAALWEKTKGHPLTQKLMKDGHLVQLSCQDSPAPEKEELKESEPENSGEEASPAQGS